MKPLTEGTTRGYTKTHDGKSKRPNRPPPSPNPKRKSEIEEVYCLKWKQNDKITVFEFFTNKAEAQLYADSCNSTLRLNHIQKMLGRYWVVQTLKGRKY